MKNKEKVKKEVSQAKKISRKQAIKKAGFYTATATSMILLLGSPKAAAASLPSAPPDW